MGISEILSLCGGLALFLYGMHMMSSGLEAAVGDRMKQMLEKLTSNTIMGVVIGTVITALIQSSSATTVMLVGFVNSGIMDLSQTVGIIMGANIGATMNGVLLAVGIGDIAPAFAFIGVCLIQFTKEEKKNHIGEIIAGLGILFIGMNMMSSSMSALRNSPAFIGFLSSCSNPILAILVGTVFTALIQSSSASVGILQALAVSGVVDLHTGIYLMFGFTIGTCITAAIASIGTTANAKRTTVIHFLFNVIGTVIFVIFCQTMPVVDWIIRLTPNSPASQVANAHVIFKVVTTLILLPFSKQLVNLSVILIKDKKEDKRPTLMERAKLTAGYSMGTSAIIIRNIRDEINYMYDIAKKNVELSYDAVINNSSENMKVIRENEDHLDELNASISEYISNVLSIPMSRQDSDIITGYFRIVGNIERIGDHADNFAGYSRFFISRGLTMSDAAVDEVRHMKSLTVDTMEFLEGDRREDAGTMLINVSRGEQDIDDMTDEYRNRQMDRMKEGVCTAEVSVIYSEMLTDFERIGDHLLNIAEDFSKMYPAKKA
ncbi:MAG: Na/Pi cotransporter family protein [Oscillospiraceae bacterium]|nr:Na/Pi cotransporter family protein [Oscillospiraceae bacterium]